MLTTNPPGECHCALKHFYTVPTALNGVMLAGRVDVRTYVRLSVTKYTITYCEQTAGPRSANFCEHMHVKKVRSPADFHSNRQLS